MDFTILTYKNLLKSLRSAGYSFNTFKEFIEQGTKSALSVSEGNKEQKIIILRHDVDLLPQNSLRFAQIQAGMGIKGSYYFRAVPESWDEKIIKEIASMGHEVGYHYENMDVAFGKIKDKSQKTKVVKSNIEYEKLLDLAYEDFCINLGKLRKLVPVNTICMHGSPRSKFDNKAIWDKYEYKDLGIIGEPYYDVDFDKVFYLTDTGRRWDGWKVSLRDKVPQQEQWIKEGLVFHSTGDIIRAANEQRLPDKIMFTFHPQRWNDKMGSWVKELIGQKAKNLGKRILVKMRT